MTDVIDCTNLLCTEVQQLLLDGYLRNIKNCMDFIIPTDIQTLVCLFFIQQTSFIWNISQELFQKFLSSSEITRPQLKENGFFFLDHIMDIANGFIIHCYLIPNYKHHLTLLISLDSMNINYNSYHVAHKQQYAESKISFYYSWQCWFRCNNNNTNKLIEKREIHHPYPITITMLTRGSYKRGRCPGYWVICPMDEINKYNSLKIEFKLDLLNSINTNYSFNNFIKIKKNVEYKWKIHVLALHDEENATYSDNFGGYNDKYEFHQCWCLHTIHRNRWCGSLKQTVDSAYGIGLSLLRLPSRIRQIKIEWTLIHNTRTYRHKNIFCTMDNMQSCCIGQLISSDHEHFEEFKIVIQIIEIYDRKFAKIDHKHWRRYGVI